MRLANCCAPVVAGVLVLGPVNIPAVAVTTNAILFVTQVPMPTESNGRNLTQCVVSVASAFGNQLGETAACGRGGALWMRYPDGTVTNLTLLAGFGTTNAFQGATSIAVRQPSVHWSGTKAVFSMVVGAPSNQTDTTKFFWQMYEITNFTVNGQIPLITPVAYQPTNYNNVSPTYGTDGRIIFTSDRPRDGSAYLYPQREEYLQLPTVTGLWSLDPQSGDLFLMDHAPSGSFTPFVDSAGRVIFTRWDHLARDGAAATDRQGLSTNYVFNYSDESSTALVTTNTTEFFPEPNTADTAALVGMNMRGNEFNLFLPWSINEDGSAEEIVNHVGRHELLPIIANATFTNDPNIVTLTFSQRFNTNYIANAMYQLREDPNNPGLLYGIDAPDLGTHAAGKIVTLTGNVNTNPDFMVINYITTNSITVNGGLYRNPVPLSNGVLVAIHTTSSQTDSNLGTVAQPVSRYDFRLKSLKPTGPYFIADKILTPGFTNTFSYYVGSNLVTYAGPLWELDPVEVVPRTVPPRRFPVVQDIESQVFAEEGIDLATFQNYLFSNDLALVVSRNVTARDHADRQQPFNLKIAGSTTQDLGAGGTVYQLAHLQLMQADQLRDFKPDGIHPAPGRRVLAQPWHDSLDENPPDLTGPAGSTQLGSDGSFAVILPARRAMSWQTVDTNGLPIVRERYWVTFQPGEVRTCANCHGINETDQAGNPAPANKPLALRQLLRWWLAANPTNSAPSGRFVFLTNRDTVGSVTNYEIYAMDPDGSHITNLTHTNASDVIPRVSYDGTKVAFLSDRGHPNYYDIWVMNSDGSNPVAVTHSNQPGATLWSAILRPDNQKIMYMGPAPGTGYNIWVANLDGTGASNLTHNATGGSDNFPYWSYDGQKIVFGSFRDNNNGEEIYMMNADGTQQTRLTYSSGRDFYPVINPDGTKIAFTSERDGHRQTYLMNVDGSGQTNISNNAFNDTTPYFSRDGRFISFISDRDCTNCAEIYVMNADGSQPTRVSNTSGVLNAYPSWGASPPAPGQLKFNPGAYAASKTSTTATVIVARTGISTGVATVNYSTLNGTAIAGSNYAAASGSLSWLDGELGAKSIPLTILNDHIIAANKSFSILLSNVTGGMMIGAPGTATVTIAEAPYDAWKFANFGTNANNAAVSGDVLDPDADGLANLVEYALGSNPSLAGPSMGPALAKSGAQWTITFNRNLAATDVTLAIQSSVDLVNGSWTVIAAKSGSAAWTTTAGIAVNDPGTGLVTVTDSNVMPASSGRFYRLRVSNP